MKKHHLVLLFLLLRFEGYSQVLWSSAAGSAWLTGTNWTGSAVPGTTAIAQFGANPTGTSGAGINYNNATNNGTQNQAVGAIEVTSARAAAFLVGNSSTSAGKNGVLTLNSTTVNSVNNVVLRNNSSQNFTIQNTQGTGTNTMAVALNSTTDNKIVIDGSGNIAISSVIGGGSSNPLTITGSGSGRVDITGTSNTFSGLIFITGAEVRFSADGSFGAVPGAVAADAITIDGGRLATTSATSYTLNANRGIKIGAAAGTSISVVTSGTLTYNGIIADKTASTGAWAKQGAGTLALGGVSTYTGATAINNGTLQLTTGSNRLPTSTSLSLGQASSTNLGSFDLNGFNQTIGSLNSTTGTNATASNNTITSGAAATLTISGSGSYGDGSNANSGIIAGSISLVKSGSGTLTLADANTYTGTTTVSGGTLQLSRSGGTTIPAAGNVTVNGGTLKISSNQAFNNLAVSSGTLVVDPGVTLTINGTYSGGGTITNNGTIVMAAANSFPGATSVVTAGFNNLTVSAATTIDANLTVAGALNLSSGTVSLGSNTLTLSGTVSRTSGNINASSGTVAFNGSSLQTIPAGTFTGNIGSLTINNASGVGFSFAPTIATDLTLAIGTFSTGSNNLTISGSVSRTSGNINASLCLVTFNGGSAQSIPAGTFTGSISALTFSNTSGVALGGSLTVTGATTISAGAYVDLSFNILNVQGTFANNGTISGSGTVALNGGSSQTITGTGMVSNMQLNNAAGATITASNTVNITGSYIPSDGVLTTNGGLVLKSNASGTGRIAIGSSGGGYISGNVTIERFVAGRRAFRFMAHPFSTSISLSQLTDDIDITGSGGSPFTTTNLNNPSAFYFDPNLGDNSTVGNNPGWVAFTASDTWAPYQSMRVLLRGTKGQGLDGLSYTPADNTMNMTGNMNQGDVTVPLTKGTGSDFVLLGNPFPSQVDMDAISTSNTGSAFYIWDATQGTKGGYTSYSFGSSSFNLPSCASFVTTLTANGSITFEEADKTAGAAGSMFKTTGGNDYMVQLRIEDSSTFWDRLILRYDGNSLATTDYKDAAELYNPEITFYTRNTNDSMLSIDTRPYTDGEIIPLGIYSTLKKKFKIVASEFNMPAGTKLFLHDKYLNVIEEIIGAGYAYPFTISSDSLSWGDKRFELNSVGKPIVSGITAVTGNSFKAQLMPNPATDKVIISYEGNTNDVVKVIIRNITGVVVAEKVQAASNKRIEVSLQDIPNGMYLVAIDNGKYQLIQKLIKE